MVGSNGETCEVFAFVTHDADSEFVGSIQFEDALAVLVWIKELAVQGQGDIRLAFVAFVRGRGYGCRRNEKNVAKSDVTECNDTPKLSRAMTNRKRTV